MSDLTKLLVSVGLVGCSMVLGFVAGVFVSARIAVRVLKKHGWRPPEAAEPEPVEEEKREATVP